VPVNHLVDARQEDVVKPRVGKDIVYKDALDFLNGGSGDVDNRSSNANSPFHRIWSSQAVDFWLR
jgi:hypothetical protein